jgi:hypothetical protein
MPYNLTEGQKDLARDLVAAVRAEALWESFGAYVGVDEAVSVNLKNGRKITTQDQGPFQALADAKFLVFPPTSGGSVAICTLLDLIFQAVDSNFGEEV